MRAIGRPLGLVLLVTLAGGCDTTQPQQAGEQTLTLTLAAPGAGITTYDVWDLYEDNDGDGIPDDIDGDGTGDVFLWCETIPPGEPVINPISVPWGFTMQISILRAGEIQPEVLTTAAALNPASNLAQYDTIRRLGETLPKLPITEQGRTFKFDLNAPRRLSAAHRDVVSATSNPLSTLNPGMYDLGNGLCSAGNPGDAKIDNQPQPYSVVFSKGDTVIVEARRGLDAPEALENEFTREPRLDAAIRVDGQRVSVSGGDTTSTEMPGAEISFWFTSK
jgi:hypothetical protein